MNLKNPTKRDLEKLVNLLKRHGGNRTKSAEELEINRTTLRKLISLAKAAGFKIPKPPERAAYDTQATTDAELADTWSVYERYNYNKAAAAEALGITHSAIARRIKQAQHKLGFERKSLGVTHAGRASAVALPKKGEVKRYILTCAQNNTALHDPTWASLIELSKYYDAEIKISTFTYCGMQDGSEKRGTEKKEGMGYKIKDRWYDPRILAYISDEFEQLAPGLVWCGHSNTLPTATDPLSRVDSLNGRASGVWPHTRIECRPIATAAGEATKFNFTTGAVTLRNYVQKKSGIIAEFYHCFGALLVEVDSEGNWYPRQLNADSEGNIYDLDVLATPTGVYDWIDPKKGGVEGLAYGDIHRQKIDMVAKEATWGKGGLVDLLKPKKQIFHDLLNFGPSHHNRRDPHVMYALFRRGENIVFDEIRGDSEFLNECDRPYTDEMLIVDSNHHRHYDRFLKEVDWRDDLSNARTILQTNEAWLDAIDEGREDDFLAYEFTMRKFGVSDKVFFMNATSEDEQKLSRILCPASGGGIEVGAHHGDKGPNGAKGTSKNLSKLGRKNVIGDKHSPGIYGGTYVTGLTGKQRQGYNIGPGSWALAHVAIYPNGKRQLLIGWKGRFFAPR